METPKQHLLLDNVSILIFFSDFVVFHVSLIYSASLLDVHTFALHNHKSKNNRFLADLPVCSKTSEPSNSLRNSTNSNQSYIQMPWEAQQQEETAHKYKNVTKFNWSAEPKLECVWSTASETGTSPNKRSQVTTRNLNCFSQCFVMMLGWEMPSGFWFHSVPISPINYVPQVRLGFWFST